MEALADFVARHAVLVLLGVVAVLLVITIAFGRLLEAYAPKLWLSGARAWDALRQSAAARLLRRLPLTSRLLTHTLTVGRYLGLYAVMAFALSVAATAAFFELADEIGAGESLANFDAVLSEALSAHLSVNTLRVFAMITWLGDPSVLIVVASVVAVVLFAAGRGMLAGAWLVATASGGVLTRVLKEIFARHRPIHEHGLLAETSWSFPSGHASGSMLVYGLLGYLIVRAAPAAWRIPVAAVALVLVVFVGSSRVLLQVHYFSDVLAGYASAAAWGALCVAGLEAVRWRRGEAPGISGIHRRTARG